MKGEHGLLITLKFRCVQGHLESTGLPQQPAVWKVSVSLLHQVWALKRNVAHGLIYEFTILALMGWFSWLSAQRQRTSFQGQSVSACNSHCRTWTCSLFWCCVQGRKQVSLVGCFFARCVWSSFWNMINTCLHVGRILGCKITNQFQCCLLLECCWVFFFNLWYNEHHYFYFITKKNTFSLKCLDMK